MFLCFQIMKSEVMRIGHELNAQKEKIKENTEKIKVSKTLPYLVSNVIEVRDNENIHFFAVLSNLMLLICRISKSMVNNY